ncbi:MAG TPA: amidohydrolase family protein [Candidatus Binataceae bacterium]|nr:amidohydrolase family protein [Candidatus Binataceae bacterium]
MSNHHTSKAIHDRLGHPVVDADGHYLEFGPSLLEYIRKVAGQRVADAFKATGDRVADSIRMTPAERRDAGVPQEAFWPAPTRNTLDRATATLPRLLYERLDEFGLDFTVLYPSAGLLIPRIMDDEMRRATCRALNMYNAETYRPLADRITPAAVIPMGTPGEAIEELEYAARTLGLKVMMMGHPMPRPIAAVARKTPAAARWARWIDTFGIDSAYDYDPVWAKCRELGVSPSFHSGSRGFGFRFSPGNFTYNHIGHFAAALEAVCKSLFLAGVTRRFPRLNIAFLEGGVAWACMLYSDLIGHWKKRNRAALEEVNPANLDRAMFRELVERWGGREIAERWAGGELRLQTFDTPNPPAEQELDDYAACGIERAEDIRDLFVRNFYFGCEADDPLNAWAYNTRINPFGAQLKTLLGSDIGHFDVVNMAEVLEEAYELVERRLITEDDLRDFLFTNPVRFFGEANPNFFKGTVIETAASRLLGAESTSATAGR